jgi:ubiquinone/menaquinone biosynthesis C-methylase UbiE
VAPVVVDCLVNRLQYAEDTYGLDTIHCFLEDIPVDDDTFDFGFCSHTIEHLYDLQKALKEMRRVTKRMVYFVCPMEKDFCFEENIAHHTHATTPQEWERHIIDSGFDSAVTLSLCTEAHVFARC